MRQKIAFCHIQKTAGTTVSSYLRSNYREEDIFPVLGVHTVNQRQIDQINDYSLIVGHFPLSFLRAFLSADWKIFTVLRQPAKRFLSHVAFNHQLAHARAKIVPSLPMADYVLAAEPFGNFQTKFLGTWLTGDEWRYLVGTRKAISYHESDLWRRCTIASASRIAQEELKQLDWVLHDEQLIGGLQRLGRDCDYWPVESLPHVNRGRYYGVDADSEALTRFAESCNQHDDYLYQIAQSHFAQPLTPQEVNSYNAQWASRYPTSGTVTASADYGFMGMGWIGPHYVEDGNGYFWSDSSLEQHLYLPITKPGLYEIELSLFLPDRQPGFSVSIALGGQTFAPVSINPNGDMVTALFRPDCVIADVPRMQMLRVIADCSTQIRTPDGLENAGFILNGILVRIVVE